MRWGLFMQCLSLHTCTVVERLPFLHGATFPCLVPSQSEVRLPERLSTEDEGVLATMRGQLREGQYKDAVATFLTERDVHPDSPLCAG